MIPTRLNLLVTIEATLTTAEDLYSLWGSLVMLLLLFEFPSTIAPLLQCAFPVRQH